MSPARSRPFSPERVPRSIRRSPSPERALHPRDTELGGIGMGIQISGSGDLVVIHVAQSSAADEAGVVPGDLLMGVDQVAVTGRPLDVVSQWIRGPIGSTVMLHLKRPRPLGEERFSVELIRHA
eukprot:CAMPEP_0175902144 /NCGR_PEP_ID=MMETSP0108-20121206/3235_1 /TAXON_ID=195067 ORGANISM="Goniomonas pacifica, Strain CCMP1869" /NCGR_SAMPLE_ID=MMETSP0108 /ASSEMBLY_ACC=CAM_ASM_000204 /LENGTH=123 /DNA_ID=CAMNT_0017223767 /DNA_START=60 /DNA_END=431 /DNA_ORIENTATION=+